MRKTKYYFQLFCRGSSPQEIPHKKYLLLQKQTKETQNLPGFMVFKSSDKLSLASRVQIISDLVEAGILK
jgi:hypothetical protein